MSGGARRAFSEASPVTEVTWNSKIKLESFDTASSFKNRQLWSDTVLECDRAGY